VLEVFAISNIAGRVGTEEAPTAPTTVSRLQFPHPPAHGGLQRALRARSAGVPKEESVVDAIHRCQREAAASLAGDDLTAAAEWFTAALRLEPTAPLFLSRAVAHWQAGIPLWALADAMAAVRLCPASPDAWRCACEALRDLPAPELASILLSWALEALPADPELLALRNDLPPLEVDPELTAEALDEAGWEVAALQGNLSDERLAEHFSQSDLAFDMTSFLSPKVTPPESVARPDALHNQPSPNDAAVIQEGIHGRGLFSSRPIFEGEVVLREAPAAAAHTAMGYCDHCAAPLPKGSSGEGSRMAVACPDCCSVFYCTDTCREAAEQAGHRRLCALGGDVAGLRASLPSALSAAERFPVIAMRLIAAALAEPPTPTIPSPVPPWPTLVGMDHLYANPRNKLDFVPLWNGYQRLIAHLPLSLWAYFDLQWYSRALAVFLNNSFFLDVPTENDATSIEGSHGTYPLPTRPNPVPYTFSLVPTVELVRPLAGLASGVFETLCLCNHSCAPNVEFRYANGTGELIALMPIPAHSELFVSYVDESLPGAERRKFLRSQYGFACRCARCGSRTAQRSR